VTPRDDDIGHRGAHHPRHVAEDGAREHSHHDRQRQSGHDARANAHQAERDDEDAGEKIGAARR
jgi:hypothetical protein